MMSLLMLTVFMQCNDDDKPKTIPLVETSSVTNVETTSATVQGEVSDDGNATLTAIGFVYSSAVTVPTLADEKVTLTGNEEEFSALLEGLASGTLYRVRAYATNSVGTGYGEVITFTTGNAAPMVTNIQITGEVEVGKGLTATYTYTDAESDAESGTTFQWYAADNATGSGAVIIAGATSLTYAIAEAYEGKYLGIGITPKAVTGIATGVETKSTFVGAVGEATTVTFMYNGQEVTYGIINSSTTGKKWLDRNLGAAHAPSAVNDYANYGDLFQWGRGDDGHQLIIRSGGTDAQTSGVGTTTTRSTTDDPGHSLFIVASNGWRTLPNDELWQGTTGVNNPCPEGWRIPTLGEFQAESLGNLDSGFDKLGFSFTGFRFATNANFYATDLYGYYWTVTLGSSTGIYFYYGLGVSTELTTNQVSSGSAMACRCVKD